MSDSTVAPHSERVQLALPERYEDLGVLARGAMGEVRRVRERSLGQVLAMKIATPGAGDDRRFQLEARAMAGLRHPGVLAVHDHGILDDGRRWFTTQEVVGETLGDAFQRFHKGADDRTAEEAFREHLSNLAAAADAVGFAHSQGVFHRDLKPENIMLGVHGEVVVVDWGLSALSLRVEPDYEDITADNELLGTPAYMPPEQAAGTLDRDHARCDVFSLGGCLYHLLCAQPPYPYTSHVAWQVALSPSPLQVEPVSRIPSETGGLIALCHRFMALDPEQRPANAAKLATELRACIETRSRRMRGLALVQQALSLVQTLSDLRAKVTRLREDAANHLSGLGPRARSEDKARGWAMEDEATQADLEGSTLAARYLQQLRAALYEDETLPEAHALLAAHYRDRMGSAENESRAQDAAFCEVMIRAHDRAGKHRDWLNGNGTVSLFTEPIDTAIDLYRYAPQDRRLEPVFLQTLPAPMRDHMLPRGSYVAVIRRPDYASVRYPFVIRRDQSWLGVPPGQAHCEPIRLYRTQDTAPDVCRVPAGWFDCGGDPEAGDAFPRHRIWVNDFAIARFPVTFGDYLSFIEDRHSSDDSVDGLLPLEGTGISERPRHLIQHVGGGHYELQSSGGRQLTPDLPVVQVDWHQARAYAAWLAQRTGLPWRLLHELEWEKAARGVDGRQYPWGSFLDPTWTCMLQSHEGPLNSTSVKTYEADVGPYGCRGMAGNIREWCLGDYTRQPPPDGSTIVPVAGSAEYRMVRGGSWSSAANFCRSACRFVAGPTDRLTSIGFRLGYSTSSVERTFPVGSIKVDVSSK